jgi:predicted HD phosphohydrolase
MDESTVDDWALLRREFARDLDGLADRILAHLCLLRGEARGFAIDRYEHSLQSATRALRDRADEETIVCALLHDIGDVLSPRNHGQAAAAVLEPYVSPENCWMVEHHDVFQGYFYFDQLGRDPNARDCYRGHPAFERTAEFCARWDQVSFDPSYDTLPLETFTAPVYRLFSGRR